MKIRDRILIIEDDQRICHYMSSVLESHDYDIEISHTAVDAEEKILSYMPDLIILDLGLPDKDGLEILENLRKKSSLPVIIVSARTHESDKVTALDLGADDYLTKPFGTEELLARIRTALRHTRTALGDNEIARTGIFTADNLAVDLNKHLVLVDNEDVHLTNIEFRIVALLAKYSGKVLTYDFIINEIWGDRSGDNNQILRVNMANIRRKIEKNPAKPQYIFTEAGIGYRMIEC